MSDHATPPATAPPAPATRPAVRLVGVSRDYQLGDSVVHALRSANLEIGRGEYVSIMGPSGSGKSTMMHLIGCLDTPTAGTIMIDGEDTSELDEYELAAVRNRRIGFVFQQFNLLSRIDVLENVMTPLMYAGIPSRQRRARALEALEAVGLSDRVRHRPTELSGGQRQRTAIARALVTEPALILADEPTGALDQATGEAIMAMLREINDRGTTIVMVTHDPNVAGQSRRIIHLLDGRIVGEDHPEAAL